MSVTENSLVASALGAPPLVHFFSSEAVVFNCDSAETHLLSLPAAKILQSIVAGDLSYRDLRGVLAAGDASDLAPALIDEYLEGVLEQLLSLELVRVIEDVTT